MKKLIECLKPFAIVAICFVVAVFAAKITEIVMTVVKGGKISGLGGIIWGNIVECGFISTIALLLFLFGNIFSKKVGVILDAVFFGIMFLVEVGLIIYYNTTGILMGKELIIRPLWETVHTIRSAVSIWVILGVILVYAFYVFVSVWFSKKNIGKIVTCVVIVIAIVSVPIFFVIQPNKDVAVVNKTWYCVSECLKKSAVEDIDIDLTKTDLDTEKVNGYLSMFPDREVVDASYPLEREDNIANVLGSYFAISDTKPDVVVIIVETLGADILGINSDGYCFMPFLDSLSRHSLLWTNCLTTTPRSFGAVPAVTGSVPHGLKGFQFGDIPEHNSLFSILEKNNYATNAFYAGNFSFDRIYDYLLAQNIDYMCDFYSDYKKGKTKDKDGTYWGYNDYPMLMKTMEVIEQQDVSRPMLNLIVTITQHEDLSIPDKKRQQYYYDKAEHIIKTVSHERQAMLRGVAGYAAASLYTDDALKAFFERYGKTERFENTIFVITGDHSANLNSANPLDAFHVPLLIWSPLLNKTERFESLVSHNEITPSLVSLLRDNYGLHTPPTIHWVSDGLDTSTVFHSDVKQYFLHYIRDLKDFVYEDMYYTTEGGKQKAYRIDKDLNLENVDNQDIINDLGEKFQTMVRVDNYVYTNNKITKHPLFPKSDEEIVFTKNLQKSIYCASNKEKPSEKKPAIKRIISENVQTRCHTLKIAVTADIKYTGKVWNDQFIQIVVESIGKKQTYSIDYISKYIITDQLKPNKWMKFELTKKIAVESEDNVKLKVYLLPTHKDDMWNPDHTVTLKDVKVKIVGED